jgi:uncharacterized surface protein with fasciclin (FAS1) repeats
MKLELGSLAVAALTAMAMAAVARATSAAEKNVVETVVAAGQFKTLAHALEAAGLTEVLTQSGPFTVFAPTDKPFAKLPPETLQSLLKPENKDQLRAILTYQVVPGKLMGADVAKLNQIKTVNGKTARVRADDGDISINEASITNADVTSSNGVIHVIDALILPPNT